MANIMEMLLAADARKVTDLPTEKMEIKRLSDLFKAKFELTLRGIPAELYADIQNQSVSLNKKGELQNISPYKMQILTLVNGVIEPSLKNKELMRHYGVETPAALAGKLFRAGEIADISKKIQELSGYEVDQEEVNEEVKN